MPDENLAKVHTYQTEEELLADCQRYDLDYNHVLDVQKCLDKYPTEFFRIPDEVVEAMKRDRGELEEIYQNAVASIMCGAFSVGVRPSGEAYFWMTKEVRDQIVSDPENN